MRAVRLHGIFLCYIISLQMEQTPVLRSCVVSGIPTATSYRQNGTLWRNDQQNYIQSVLQSHWTFMDVFRR